MSWQKVKLKEVLKQYRVQHIVQDDNEYKQVSILNDGSVVLRGSKIGKEIGRKRQFIIDLNTYPETLIFTRQLLLQGSIGIASEDVNDCIVTENMPMFSIQTSKIDKDFLILFLKSEVFKSRIRKIELSGSAQKSIHEKTFLDIEFHIPKIEEQKEIVVELLKLKSNSNSISTEIINQLDLIKQLRQAFLREAMQGKLCHAELVSASQETGHDLLTKIKAEKAQLIAEKKLKKEKELPLISEDEIPFEIPEHWAWCRLGEITKVKVGSTPSRNEPKFWKGNIPWVSSGEVANNFIFDTRERITQEGFENTSLIIYPKGSVLVAMIGQGKTRGQTAILKIDATTNQNVAGMIIQHNYLISEYLWYFFLSRYETTRVGASGGNQPALNGIKISNTIFPLPPLNEQEQIVTKLEELMAFCDGLEQSIKESQGYNEKLLQQVLREALQGEKNKYNIII